MAKDRILCLRHDPERWCSMLHTDQRLLSWNKCCGQRARQINILRTTSLNGRRLHTATSSPCDRSSLKRGDLYVRRIELCLRRSRPDARAAMVTLSS